MKKRCYPRNSLSRSCQDGEVYSANILEGSKCRSSASQSLAVVCTLAAQRRSFSSHRDSEATLHSRTESARQRAWHVAVMLLAASVGNTIVLEAERPNEVEAMTAMSRLIDGGFSERR